MDRKNFITHWHWRFSLSFETVTSYYCFKSWASFSHLHYNIAFQEMKSTFHYLCKNNSLLSLPLFIHFYPTLFTFLQNCQTCTFEKRNNCKSTFRISTPSKLVSLVLFTLQIYACDAILKFCSRNMIFIWTFRNVKISLAKTHTHSFKTKLNW